MTINNIQHFLLANEEAIESIPALEERLSTVERHIGIGDWPEPTYEVVDLGEPVYQSTLKSKFDQDDWDELFTDGGETKGSFDADDWGELHTEVPIAANPTLAHPDI